MAKYDVPTGVSIEITGTYNVAVARQHLRKLSEELHWSQTLLLRAIAAFTALAETAHFKDRRREHLVVYIEAIEREKAHGIEFSADADLDIISRDYPAARWQLERVSDEFEINRRGNTDHIVIRVLATEKRS